MPPLPHPDPFWEIRVHEPNRDKGVSGLCVGYEQGQWRYSAFADHIMEWLPEFCLNSKERGELSHESAVKSLRKAAKLIYQTDKYAKRGASSASYSCMPRFVVFSIRCPRFPNSTTRVR